MPTVAVDKADLFEKLGHQFTSEEFDRLCFEYGLELDEDTTEEVEAAIKAGLPAERPQLKIEIPANRYDLLCIEGISRALGVFLGKQTAPRYRLLMPPGGEKDLIHVKVHPDVVKVRPYFACAVLRNLHFTPRSYASFIDLQDKLHQNIGRRRWFVAIGTHDLDTVEQPFRFEARDPDYIKFVPLNRTQPNTARELMTIYENDKHLNKYLPIIRDSPVYPIIYDNQDRVLSMPPIINSEHSKISLNTRNVFIDVTATDETKLHIVVNEVAIMFSEYCQDAFTVEPCKLIFPDGSTRISPDLSYRTTVAHTSYINSCTGLSLTTAETVKLLQKMSLEATPSKDHDDEILVDIPPTRPDILHEVDIMEDAAVAYGFNNLPHVFPATSTVAQPLEIGKLSDVIRTEWALAGWVEALSFILCSHDENYAFLNRVDNGKEVVKIGNPKTLEFQIVRTSLLPGLLKTVRENRSHPLPIRLFECSDVVFKDPTSERQSRNERHAAALWCNKTAGFEVVHGILDRAMRMLEVPRINSKDGRADTGYYIKEGDDPAYFAGRAAVIYYRPPSEGTSSKILELKEEIKETLHISRRDMAIGTLGILHPSVLQKFEITYPCSAVEFNIEPFKKSRSRP
ncbi:phenylalanyl-tRNA synthetase subunit beta [Coniophora puteana RWD-64-598 SS2]|uniref:Phenylalanine--tRNA ligase beta subunit n=1 Tax=Coniophora puteana (strain RWD-64-598) TaxID=741705 RepID=A0A5M3MTK6_CONPW|nr:phenylalanyl-tRNA synthetase subunit beta [Coniophora puteana RWD-64-598 SS2]EIW82084.1 phenylalanyl-tRNA synthetase subunit beta [Coniophora puteana RWD-64-598 SS2]